MTYRAVEEATRIAVNYFESIHKTVDTDSIHRRVLGWYNHTDVTEPEVLAAAAIEGDYFPTATYDWMLNVADWYFGAGADLPKDKNGNLDYHAYDMMDEFSIGEIEMAQRDSLWW